MELLRTQYPRRRPLGSIAESDDSDSDDGENDFDCENITKRPSMIVSHARRKTVARASIYCIFGQQVGDVDESDANVGNGGSGGGGSDDDGGGGGDSGGGSHNISNVVDSDSGRDDSDDDDDDDSDDDGVSDRVKIFFPSSPRDGSLNRRTSISALLQMCGGVSTEPPDKLASLPVKSSSDLTPDGSEAGTTALSAKVNKNKNDARLRRALRVVAHKAAHYDRARHGALRELLEMTGSMTFPEFRKTLHSVFDIRLSKGEADALGRHFDADGDNTVDASEFFMVFFKLANKGKARLEHRRKLHDRKVQQRLAHQQEAHIRRHARRVEATVSEFSPEDESATLAELLRVAASYDKGSTRDFGIKAFEGLLTPTAFKEQLKRNFNMRVSSAQLGALMHIFDKDANGMVDGSEFLIEFGRMAHTGKLKQKKRQMRNQMKREQHRIRAEQRALARFRKLSTVELDENYTEEDFDSAFDKIGRVAALYKRDRNELQAFEASMEPSAFGEQLRRTFGIHLPPVELAATIHHFDKDGNGMVDGAEFLMAFFRLGKDKQREMKKKNEQEQANRIMRKERFLKRRGRKRQRGGREARVRLPDIESPATTTSWGLPTLQPPQQQRPPPPQRERVSSPPWSNRPASTSLNAYRLQHSESADIGLARLLEQTNQQLQPFGAFG